MSSSLDPLILPLLAGLSLSTGLCAAAGILVLAGGGHGGGGSGRSRSRRMRGSSDDVSDDEYTVSRASFDARLVGARASSPPHVGEEPTSDSRRKAVSEVAEQVGEDDIAIRSGFSMEDAMALSENMGSKATAKSPSEVLRQLQRGNTRFWMGVATRPEVSAFERRAMIMKQHPCCAILGCSDSRVPIEIVFDQGLGDIFVIRVAGNCLDTATIGSLEYACLHLKVKCLVVMGHEGCGAVKAARLTVDDINKEPPCLSHLLHSLKKGLQEDRLVQVHDQRACDREAVVSNVKVQVEALLMNESIRPLVDKGELLVVGAFYEMSSGIVDFYRASGQNDMCGQCIVDPAT